MVFSCSASDFSCVSISFLTAAVGARRRPRAAGSALVSAEATRDRGAETKAPPPSARSVTKRRRFMVRDGFLMALLLGFRKSSVDRRDAMDQRAVGARVFQEGDRVPLGLHLPGEDRARGERLPGQDVEPQGKRGAQGEARVGGPGA